jgi:hypothetical protein
LIYRLHEGEGEGGCYLLQRREIERREEGEGKRAGSEGAFCFRWGDAPRTAGWVGDRGLEASPPPAPQATDLTAGCWSDPVLCSRCASGSRRTKLRRGDAPFFSGFVIWHRVGSSQPPLACGDAAGCLAQAGELRLSGCACLGAPPNMCHLLL